MAFIKTSLVIIPGLGDRVNLYKLTIPIWKILGYDVHVFSFGWEDADEDFSAALERLIKYIDNLQVPRVDLVGVSAAGTVAINALALRPVLIKRVVTVATPFIYLRHLSNTKLQASILCLHDSNIADLKPQILSMHGLHDKTVPISASRFLGIETQKIYAISHGVIIATALTFYSANIRQFLRKDSNEIASIL